jgi:hypothetical protein
VCQVELATLGPWLPIEVDLLRNCFLGRWITDWLSFHAATKGRVDMTVGFFASSENVYVDQSCEDAGNRPEEQGGFIPQEGLEILEIATSTR